MEGPQATRVGVLRSPAAFPLWLAAWSGVHCRLNLLDSPCGTADCLVFQTAKQPLHLGHTLLGAYENGDLNVLQEAIDFAMGREFLSAIYDDFERVLDECAPHVADRILSALRRAGWSPPS